MKKPKISFLVTDISSPGLGVAVNFARMLAGRYDSEIAGPDFGIGVSAMYQDLYTFKVVQARRMYRVPDFFADCRRLAGVLEGEVIVSVKAFANTLPVALREKRRRGRKVIVYLDEWDGALFRQLSPWRRMLRVLRYVHHPLDDIYYPLVERLIPRADAVISTSTFLQEKFGGRIVPFGVDTDHFRPQPPEKTLQLRRELGLEQGKLIVFGGVARPHKGVEDILEALVVLNSPALRLLIVGPGTFHLDALMRNPRYKPFLAHTGHRSKEDMPAYLGLADLVVLPLSDTLLSRSQVPCKVFEAMAMAKPIIASAVSDLPSILEGCGWVVAPDHTAELAAAIRFVLSEPAEARRRGEAARARCIQQYSLPVAERAFAEVIEEVRSKP